MLPGDFVQAHSAGAILQDRFLIIWRKFSEGVEEIVLCEGGFLPGARRGRRRELAGKRSSVLSYRNITPFSCEKGISFLAGRRFQITGNTKWEKGSRTLEGGMHDSTKCLNSNSNERAAAWMAHRWSGAVGPREISATALPCHEAAFFFRRRGLHHVLASAPANTAGRRTRQSSWKSRFWSSTEGT
jgi:hypothetical protein